jgi:hypothetical protein
MPRYQIEFELKTEAKAMDSFARFCSRDCPHLRGNYCAALRFGAMNMKRRLWNESRHYLLDRDPLCKYLEGLFRIPGTSEVSFEVACDDASGHCNVACPGFVSALDSGRPFQHILAGDDPAMCVIFNDWMFDDDIASPVQLRTCAWMVEQFGKEVDNASGSGTKRP